MLVIAANRAAILKLAAAQNPTDPTLRRLQGYVSLQTFACLWGLVPGAVEDRAARSTNAAMLISPGRRRC